MATKELPKATVPSVLKAARLLDEVAGAREALSLADLASRLGLAKSSTLSLCTSLTVTGLLRRAEDGCYQLGTHLVDLAHAYLSRTDLTREFDQAIHALKVLDRDGAVLAIRDGTDVVYIACRNGTLPLAVTYRIGMRLPVSCTATGKALISTLDDQEIRALYRGQTLPRLTDQSCPSLDALLKDIHAVRLQGYAIDEGEVSDGVCCVGVPICDPVSGQALAAVAVTMLKGTEMERKRGATVETLKALAELLLHRLKMLR